MAVSGTSVKDGNMHGLVASPPGGATVVAKVPTRAGIHCSQQY